MLGGSEESIKLIVVGNGNVGKTCLLRRFVRGDFVDQYKKTIGAEFMEKDVFLRSSNNTVKLMLWDTAGQEVFGALTQAYYRGAGAAIVTFSTVDRDSFMSAQGWKQKVESVCGPIVMVLCQTKFDLSHEAAVTNEEAEALAVDLKIPFFRVSTKDDFNITQLFEFTAQHCIGTASANVGDGAGPHPTPAGPVSPSAQAADTAGPSSAAEATPVAAAHVRVAVAATAPASRAPAAEATTDAQPSLKKKKGGKSPAVYLTDGAGSAKKRKIKCMLL